MVLSAQGKVTFVCYTIRDEETQGKTLLIFCQIDITVCDRTNTSLPFMAKHLWITNIKRPYCGIGFDLWKFSSIIEIRNVIHRFLNKSGELSLLYPEKGFHNCLKEPKTKVEYEKTKERGNTK